MCWRIDHLAGKQQRSRPVPEGVRPLNLPTRGGTAKSSALLRAAPRHVKFSISHTAFGVNFCEFRQDFTQISRLPWQRKTENIFTPHFCRAVVLTLLSLLSVTTSLQVSAHSRHNFLQYPTC